MNYSDKKRIELLAERNFDDAYKYMMQFYNDLKYDHIFLNKLSWTASACKKYSLSIKYLSEAIVIKPKPSYLQRVSKLAMDYFEIAKGEEQKSFFISLSEAKRSNIDFIERISTIINAKKSSSKLSKLLISMYTFDQAKDWITFLPEQADKDQNKIKLEKIGIFSINPERNQDVMMKRFLRGLPWDILTISISSLILEHCESNHWIVDIGANTGQFSIPALNNFCNPIMCIEPVEINYKELLKNISHNTNAKSKRIIPKKIAIGSSVGSVKLDRPNKNNNGTFRISDSGEEVPMDRLGNITSSCFAPDDRIGLIKIDVEGHESDVIEGAVDLIHNDKPYILCEIFDSNFENILHLLSKINYSYIKYASTDYFLYPND